MTKQKRVAGFCPDAESLHKMIGEKAEHIAGIARQLAASKTEAVEAGLMLQKTYADEMRRGEGACDYGIFRKKCDEWYQYSRDVNDFAHLYTQTDAALREDDCCLTAKECIHDTYCEMADGGYWPTPEWLLQLLAEQKRASVNAWYLETVWEEFLRAGRNGAEHTVRMEEDDEGDFDEDGAREAWMEWFWSTEAYDKMENTAREIRAAVDADPFYELDAADRAIFDIF